MEQLDLLENSMKKVMTKMKINTLLTYMLGLVLLNSCSNGSKPQDTATRGTITVAVDESLKPIIEAQKDVFESIYPEAKLNMIYTNEADALYLLANDSARIAIVTRELYPEEQAPLNQLRIRPRYTDIAYDAIAIIANNENPHMLFTKDQLAKVLSGEIKTWKQLNDKLQDEPINVVFDSPKSGAIRLLQDTLLNGEKVGTNCFALHGNPEVIQYVKENKNALGLIGVAWISDRDDTTSVKFTQEVKVLEMVPADPSTAEEAYMGPYQAFIALKQYPLWRKVMVVSREGRIGLGTGFASFIASDKGQRIVLKSGLVPALAPIRIVQVNDKPLNL
jgi:phosphate transport system substrate-binding protein